MDISNEARGGVGTIWECSEKPDTLNSELVMPGYEIERDRVGIVHVDIPVGVKKTAPINVDSEPSAEIVGFMSHDPDDIDHLPIAVVYRGIQIKISSRGGALTLANRKH